MTNRNVYCPKCGKSFKKQQSLDKHIKAKHKGFKNVSRKYRGLTPSMIKALGDGFYEQKNHRKAKDLYETYLKLCPGDVEVRDLLNRLRYLYRDYRKDKHTENKKLDGPKKIEKYPSEKKENKKAHIHLFWWLGRPPEQKYFNILDGFLFKNGAKFIWEDSVNKHFRIFNDDGSSLHIEIELGKTGVNILTHIDIEIHGRVIHNKQSREILLSLYGVLKKKRIGRVFLLPREENELQRFLDKGY